MTTSQDLSWTTAYASLVLSIVLGVFGQLSLKQGSLQSDSSGFFLFDLWLIGGLTLYFTAAIFYILALRVIPVSVAFPSVSISYVAVSLLAHVIWGEPFGVRQLLALFLIGAGIALLSYGAMEPGK